MFKIEQQFGTSHLLINQQLPAINAKIEEEKQPGFAHPNTSSKTHRSIYKMAKIGAVAAAAGIVCLIALGTKNRMVADHFRQLGNQALDQAEPGSFARERLCFPVKAGIDHAYIGEWKFKEQCPDLCEYVKYQLNHNYYNHLNPEVLQDLIPGKSYLTDQETRDFYNANVKQTIPCLVAALQDPALGTKGCYDIALAASETRNHFKEDARIRSKETPGWLLALINLFRYGGEVDFPQIVGKYRSCSELFNATVRTNKKVDRLAKRGHG